MSYGKWRPFVHVMGGIQRTKSGDNTFHPAAFDIGGGVDRKLPFKNFSWRFEFDYVHNPPPRPKHKKKRGSTGGFFGFFGGIFLLFLIYFFLLTFFFFPPVG